MSRISSVSSSGCEFQPPCLFHAPDDAHLITPPHGCQKHHYDDDEARAARNSYELLIVDDDPQVLRLYGHILSGEGYQVRLAESGDDAIVELQGGTIDVVITDLVMKPVDGIAVLKAAKELDPCTMVIILTGHANLESAIRALRHDADDYMLKPCEAGEISFRVSRCIQKIEFQRRLKIYEKLLPVCCVCGKIRDDEGKLPGAGQWMQVDKYIWKKAKMEVTSAYCPGCADEIKAQLAEKEAQGK